MLRKKMMRDILQNKSQFLTIFFMVLIGVMVYTGIEAYMNGMIKAADTFYSENNLQDLNAIGTNFSKDDLEKVKSLQHVNDAERKLVLTGIDADDTNKTYLISFIESNNISKFYIVDGIPFDASKKGVWVDSFYAKENNLNVGDKIKIKYDTFVLEEEILGLINVPDHIYDVKDESEIVPNRKIFGYVYLSSNEIPESYIKDLAMKEMKIDNEDIFKMYIKDFKYQNYIPYNYIMVDVDDKSNTDNVKNAIEDNIDTLAIIKIEDTASYTMYQGEIDEGKAYIGVFSGLFLFIAMLSVITTMTRVVKKQKLQIGTMKALGIKNSKITLHYISYGFWISLLASICGILLGRYFIGNVFIGIEMSFFEVPNGVAIINPTSYIVAILVVITVSLITYLTCRKELKKIPAESLRREIPKVKNGSLDITTKGIFKKLGFSAKWNLRDILRNKFRTLTGVVGIVGCCTLIVCAFGMLNSINHFISLQFEELYNFDYKLTLKENLSQEQLEKLMNVYGTSTSQTLGIETKNSDNTRTAHSIFVTDAGELVRFQDAQDNYINIDSTDGVYITRKMAESEGYNVGDTISWHVYSSNKYYESKIVGLNKDPQSQNITATRAYIESLGLNYTPDSLYTNYDLKGVKEVDNVSLIQDIEELKTSMESMLSMMKKMITIIIVFAIILGAIIIYNMGVLSYSEKQYQFATLKVLGFKDNKIKHIFIEQNTWITILSIIIGLPAGYFLTSWIFKACLDETFDFGVYINISTYILATVITFIASYLVLHLLAKKVKKIDMVSSLKGNE